MIQFILKTVVSGLLVATISSVSKRFPGIGGIIASLPLTSIIAMIWLYQDTQDIQKISLLSNSIFWMTLPSLSFFIILPYLIQRFKFYPGLLISCILLAFSYSIFSRILKILKINH